MMRSKIQLSLLHAATKVSLFNSHLLSRRFYHFSPEFKPYRSFWSAISFNNNNNVSNVSSIFTSHMLHSCCLFSTCNSSQLTVEESNILPSEITYKESSIVPDYDTSDEVVPIDTWEEEDEAEAKIGDGGDGGGVVFHKCAWGDRVLSIANEVLLQLGDDFKLFAFKTSPRGYIYVRLDKLSNEYGCPGIEELKSFSRQYKAKLDQVGETGDIPTDLALEVSSPGAERLLKVPDDMDRFKDMIMRVDYVENSDSQSPMKNGVFHLVSVEPETRCCTWRLADVKENRDPKSKGRPLSRAKRDLRLRLPYDMFKRVTLYLDC